MKPVRLLAEILLIVAVAEISIAMMLPLLIPNVSALNEGLLDVTMLVGLCAPAIYWRFTRVFQGIDQDIDLARTNARHSGRAVALTAMAQITGLLLTAGGVWWQTKNLDEHARYQFDRAAERTQTEVLRRLNQSVDGLRGAKGSMAAQPNFRRKEFRAYAMSRDITAEFPGIRGFAFIERVQRQDLQAFIARERADGAPEFAVRSSGSAPDLLVVKYLEPVENNSSAIGFDVGQEPVRRRAAERAIDTGEPALTGLIELVQDEKKTPGFLYFVPVYKIGTHPQTRTERRRDLFGLLSVPIVAAELFEGAAAVSDQIVDFELFEGIMASPEKLIFSSAMPGVVPAVAGAALSSSKRKYSVDDVVYVGSQPLTLRVYEGPRFTAAQDRSSLTFVGAGGILLSLFVALTVWLLAVSRQRAQALADAMTTELNRMAQVVQHTGSAVAIMDRQMRVVWVNPGFMQITGYTREETLGQRLGDLLGSSKSDPVALAHLQACIEQALPCRVELINRGKEGREYWVDVELQPSFDQDKNLVGFMEIGTDITQSKHTQHQLEVALREADAILTTVRTHAIVSETSRDDVILSVNDAFCQISGYSREELIGRSHSIINSGVHSPDFWANFWHTIGSGQPWRGEVCNRAKDGTLYWVDSMIAPFVGADGEIEKYVSIRTDITARRRAADQLGHSEATFSAIFSQSSTAMALLSRNGRTIKTNVALCELTGYPQEELMELTLADISHPDEWDVDRLQDARLFAGEMERYQRVKRYVHRDGHLIWGLAGVSVVRAADEEVSFIIVQIVDITARKRAEEALNVSNALMEESQAIAKVGGWELDVKSGGLYWTHETYRIHETTPEEFNPTVDAGVGYFLPDSRERIKQAMQAALEYGQSYDLELQTHTTQGHLIDVRTTGTATVEDGKTVRVSGIFQDITQRKQYERSLLEARAAAELATQSKGQFLANMSHEIRTPMNAILGMLKLLGNTALSNNQLDYVRKTEGASRSLLGLINDILDFSKIDAGKMELDPRPFRVDRLMRDLAVVLTANVGAKPVEVLYDLDPAIAATLVGDAMRLQQVLINLAGNAVKFTSAGQVVISLQQVPAVPMASGSQDLPDAPDMALIRFAVKDSGIGIAPENQAKIFSGFSQAEASTSRRFGGTGLGLAISQRLVQVMGGQIGIESQLGVGSTFSFTLRLPRVPAGESIAPEPAATLPTQRVLVIDDNPVSRELMAKMMRSFGWDVALAQDGQAGLDLIASRATQGVFPFDCVYVDWQMPGLDGWETLQRVRALHQTLSGPAPRLIMLSANSREDLSQRTQAEQVQLNAFLLKPVTASMLFNAALHQPVGNETAVRAPRSSLRQLAGMRVLVVEDNAINQQVAEELLSFEGAQVSIAADGRQGVNAVASAKKQFDAVLMDIQMPVMDGYAATHMIRESLGLRHLPIIGLTANAMPSDREACLRAGMNEHVGKPFDMAHLVTVLLRLTGPQAGPGAMAPDLVLGEPPPAPVQGPQGQAVEAPTSGRRSSDVPEMDLSAALERMGGLKPLYLRAGRELQKTLASFNQDLKAAVQSGGWDQATGLLHTLKGNAGTLGLTRLAGELASLESFSRSRPTLAQGEARLLALATGIGVAQQALAQAIEQVSADLGQASPAVLPAAAADMGACRAVVARMIGLLKASDLSVLGLFADSRNALAALPEAQLEALETALQDLDLQAALVVCQAIMAAGLRATWMPGAASPARR